MNNVIILTTGLSGSSLFTSVIKQAGYWCGDETVVKNNLAGNYDTFENSELIDLNERLFKELGVEFNANEGQKLSITNAELDYIDLIPYKQFMQKCQKNSPWVLKDPRLRFILEFWLKIINLNSCKFIIVYRKPWKLWVSMLNKRQIISFKQLKKDEQEMQRDLLKLLNSKSVTAQLMCFDDLITKPRIQIDRLNNLLGSSLTEDDLSFVLDRRLLKKSQSLTAQIKAILIFIKNIHRVNKSV